MVVLAAGAGLFYHGYGPMALMDRDSVRSASEAKGQLDDTLRAATGAISPSLSYFGGVYVVERAPEHADGEPSLRSSVTASVSVRTRVAPAKVPVLLDRMKQLWDGQCHSGGASEVGVKRYTDLYCSGRGDTLFTLSVVSSTTDSTVQVLMSAEAFTVRYQPDRDYGTPPTGELLTGHEPAPDVDDPYWSH
ncbi:hypothetical protein [Streptomyces sp. CBMA123]|uniref:hypothetical protein n=1 Tax=Streptomyces sp. CBMA123 TaxID=1896313 RepID=UPI001662008C|nr:hypothetical protein [Streptomyces sp. CBMA123]MBD0691648.1 hypothetical protein [Streptomyces sp. CBMA123]